MHINKIYHEDLAKILLDFEKWIDLHDKMFDHSKYHEDCTENDIKEWLAFHDSILKE